MAADPVPSAPGPLIEPFIGYGPDVQATVFPRRASRKAELAAKRCLDVGVALSLLLILAPLLLLLALLVRCGDGGPALFRQTRVGRRGCRFSCFKFRSMVVDAEEALAEHLRSDPDAAREWAEMQKLSRDPRVTRLGRFLRRTSLDELPQILNVLSGTMSLVGPRPILPVECARYADKIDAYHAMRPGITGLWQVSGRSACTYEERVALDVAYAAEWNLHRDLVILARTIPAVLTQRGSC